MGGRRKENRNSVGVDGGGGRDESTSMRLLEWLPDAERYETDAYGVYEWLPRNRHVVGKCGEVNRNEGLHSMLCGKLNRLVRRTKGCVKERGDAGESACAGVCAQTETQYHLRVRIPIVVANEESS